MNNINSRIQFRRVCKLSKASPEVLYTLWAESPFHDSMGLGGVGCANSLGDTVWSQNYGLGIDDFKVDIFHQEAKTLRIASSRGSNSLSLVAMFTCATM